jgi:hypothetical protein
MAQMSRFTFRITLWRPWLLALTLLALPVAVGVAVSSVAGERGAVAHILLGFAGVALALLLPIGLTIRASRCHVDPDGIGGPNNSLVSHRLQWSEIESVKPWLIPGYRYLQVNGVGRPRAFWLPLFLTDMPAFGSAIRRYAPPGNALRRYLEKQPT